jgi:Family of unknown function (DUF6319)
VDTATDTATDAVAKTAADTTAETGTTPAAPTANDAAESADTPKRGRPRKQQSTARKTRTVELILTVTGTAEGEWQAELTHAGKRVVQGLPVAAAAVSRAAKELHPDIFGGIETVLSAAREQHRVRMEELQAELDKVKQALAELDD